MANKDLEKFIKSFEDFTKHSQEQQSSDKSKKTKEYAISVLEKQAAELEITVDYYLAEFI